ncbi:hypothetical protein FDECE_3575 [Fusarium decemcellulare]|nr:hypothetical protein FDECE_3575 [Fusarium decemcellulare]
MFDLLAVSVSINHLPTLSSIGAQPTPPKHTGLQNPQKLIMPTMRAFLTDGKGSGSVQLVDTPIPAEGEVLVKICYAAFNPGDWKVIKAAPTGLVCGCDFAGVIDDANDTDWIKGQRVAGFIHGTNTAHPNHGAFAEYTTIKSTLIYAIPDNITFQQASTIPLAFATATQAMYRRLGFAEPSRSNHGQKDFLVYGASTSVGQYAVQLGKLGGLTVIAVASSKNHELLKRLGADVVVDYRDEGWVDRVKEATHGTLKYAFDCIAQGGSSETIVKALSQTEGDHLVALNPLNKNTIEESNSYVKAESTIASTVFGKPLHWGIFDNENEPIVEDNQAWERYLGWLTELLQKGRLIPNHVKELGTLDNVPNAAELSNGGKLSAEKIVFSVGA